MEHEANGLVLIFLGKTSACRQDGSLRLLSAAARPTVYKIGNGPARGKQPKQRIDEASGLLQWKVTVSDPSADKDRDKSISMIMLARVQPVPPDTAIAGFDFRPVHFEGLTIEPRVMGEKFKYLGWVFRATGMCAPHGTAKGHSKLSPMPLATADKSAA